MPLRSFEFGQALFQRRCASAWPVISGLAPLPQPYSSELRDGRGQTRIGRQAEIIVRAEIDQLLALITTLPIGRLPRGQTAAQTLLMEDAKLLIYPFQRVMRIILGRWQLLRCIA